MKGLLVQDYNQTGTWLDNLPVTKYLQQSLSRFLLFYSGTTLFIQVINIRKSHQRGIITKIKSSTGADFSNAGVHRLSQQWTDLSKSPFSALPKNTLTHTSTVLLDILSGQPQPWQTTVTKKVLLFLFFSFLPPPLFLSHLLFMQSSTHHVQTKQCPHVSVVQPQRLGKILSGQLQVFQPPLSVLHLCEEALKHGQ